MAARSYLSAQPQEIQTLAAGFAEFLAAKAAEGGGGRRLDRAARLARPLSPWEEMTGGASVRYDSRALRTDAQEFVARSLGLRLDASFTSMFARQLEYIYTWTADIEYPDLKARQLIPVDTEVPSGADYFTYRMYDVAELAALLHNYAKNSFPESDVYGNEFKQGIKGLGNKYSYSVQDMRAAAMAGVPLEAKKASSARYGIEKALERIAAYGNVGANLYGITNAPGVQAVTKISPAGTWAYQIQQAILGGTLTQTAQAILQDVNAMANQIFTATLGKRKPTTLALPTASYAVLATTPRAPGFTDDTILEYILESSPWLQEITDWAYLNTLGVYVIPGITFTVTNASAAVTASATLAAYGIVPGTQLQFAEQPGVTYTVATFNGTTGLTLTANYSGTTNSTHGASILNVGLATMYEKSPEVLQLVVSQEFEQFPPQQDGLTWEVYCHMRTGGVNVIRPLAVATMSGIA